MRTYVLLIRNDADGAGRMLSSGRFGAADQSRSVEALSGRVLGQWAVTGCFDAVLVVELPDEAAAVAMTLSATAAGQYVELLNAFDPEVVDAARDRYDQAAAALAEESAGVAEPRTETQEETGGSDDNTSLAPLYAWSRRGERAFVSVPRNWDPNVTLLASMSAEGMGPCLAVEGSTTREVFEAYLKGALAPSLKSGQVVVMDNLSSHKGSRVRELIEQRGCEILYLPPYSPDLNPIEEAFAKLKALLRRAGARTREALIEAMGQALDAVTASDARGFLEHRGYRDTA